MESFKNFEDLIRQVKTKPQKKRMAIAAAADQHIIEAAVRAQQEQIAEPILVGNREKITALFKENRLASSAFPIIDAETPSEAAEKAVALVKSGEADFLMKGMLDTKVFLKAVVNKTDGLGQKRTMSHFAWFEVPGYPKLLSVVDGGMVMYPDLEQKKEIIENTVNTLRALGYGEPKVGVLACVEKVNPKMPETLEAAALATMNQNGQLAHCIVEGPISFDCAYSAEIAAIKHYKSRIAGDVDILLAPNIHTGNIMGKMLTCISKAKMAGFVVGAACPIILTSRGATSEEKYLSIVVAAAASKGGGEAK
ncbi:bifunctional enoyl-CoA hydratase/phosphate acetyltransferase [Enterococcus hirae]|nr:bifunctional enoyl-CoA hydratase/phosphate acetyltransferase [Enterococcus hirae]